MTADRESTNYGEVSAATTQPPEVPKQADHPLCPRVASALFYALSATLIVIINKLVLTSYQFPSFLVMALGQMVMTVIILMLFRLLRLVEFPRPHSSIFIQIFPLPLLFFGCIVLSLGGTQRLSLPMVVALRKLANLFILVGEYLVLGLPMYIVLRRFSNLFIMVGEYFLLGVVASPFIQFTIYLMIFGALVAASNDLAFDLLGYAYIMGTNVVSSANGVFTKQKLNKKTFGPYGLMFYNSLIMILPTAAAAYYTGDLHKSLAFQHWGESVFVGQFLLACMAGFLVNYSTLLCTQYNSALTTSVVGVLKNTFVAYAGMYIGGDYIYSLTNFLGITVSVVGGMMYSYATFRIKSKPIGEIASSRV